MLVNKRIVVVLGAGRSGTSLLMNLASSLGVSVSGDLVGPNETNKKGAFEDTNILKKSRSILRYFNRNGSALSFLPMPDNWLDSQFTKDSREILQAHVESEMRRSHFWGFKEPVTAKLLPLWKRIFKDLDVHPLYLVSLRRPSEVAESFKKAYGVPAEISSLIWISRYTDAILNAGSELYIYDYDDWFSKTDQTIERLAGDLDVPLSPVDKSQCRAIIDGSLRTAVANDDSDREAADLYKAIQLYANSEITLEELIDFASRSREYLSRYDFLQFSVDSLGKKADDLFQKLSVERKRNGELRRLNRDVALKQSDPFLYIRRKRKVSFSEGWGVVAGVASFKAREDVFRESIESVKDQFDHIYVYLNGYGEVPEFLKSSKFSVFLSEDFVDLSANGKIFSLSDVGSCYFFTLDDDILYPPDYVSVMVDTLRKYNDNVGVSVHASILPEYPEWYYERYAMYPFQKELNSDRFVNLIGSGTFAFHTDRLKVTSEDFFPDVMVDLRFSILAKQQGMPLVCVARPEYWLKALVQGEGLYQDFLFKKTIHTEQVIAHAPWGFSIYSDIVLNSVGETFEHKDDYLLSAELYDQEFIKGVREGFVPENWLETKLYRSKVEEREFAKQPMAKYKLVKRELAKYKKNEEKLKKIQRSRVYRLSLYIAKAIKNPFWDAFRLPLNVIRLVVRK
ncbi:glycosyltransferase [Marinobacter sp. JSM 1782161]|uniref:glycosyltransferase n=1 Tax=Marinobacter sp. JSM 1782161 TaxID=2685906 RepID=UPI001403B800|nr:glycosyltransferase [Marinobacter sp. JSM 1782161]